VGIRRRGRGRIGWRKDVCGLRVISIYPCESFVLSAFRSVQHESQLPKSQHPRDVEHMPS
jgi:hypothetical protein